MQVSCKWLLFSSENERKNMNVVTLFFFVNGSDDDPRKNPGRVRL
jgi:hypothetical protein